MDHVRGVPPLLRLHDASILHHDLHHLRCWGKYARKRELYSKHIRQLPSCGYLVSFGIWDGLAHQGWPFRVFLGHRELCRFPLHMARCCQWCPQHHLQSIHPFGQNHHGYHRPTFDRQDILLPQNLPNADSNRCDADQRHLRPQNLPLLLHHFDFTVLPTFRCPWSG